jgi:hypothetical protein
LNAFLSRQHLHTEAQELSPDHNYHDLGLQAENILDKEQTPGIDLLNEPQEWILGFDAGFNNRPLVSGNTEQYCEGYSHGQQAWKDPAASSSLSSAANESSNLASLDADTIDPRLLDFDVYANGDLFKTPTQPIIATRSDGRKSNIVERNCNNISSPSLGGPRQSNVQLSGSHPSSGLLLDMNYSGVDASTTANNAHKASMLPPSWTPINTHRASRPYSAPTARTPNTPLATYDAHESITHTSPCVRRSLSMAKHARVEAELLESQGNLDAAAAAVVDAAHWEKKARRLQSKNESQRRIRAQKRAGKSAMWT